MGAIRVDEELGERKRVFGWGAENDTRAVAGRSHVSRKECSDWAA